MAIKINGNTVIADNQAFTTTSTISATGNITGGNLSVIGTVTAAGINTGSSPISTTGNVSGGNILTGGIVSATGNVQGGNIRTAGLISATGNITGNFLLGNGSQLTGIDATSIQSGTSNVRVVSSGGNVAVGIGGTANVVVVATTGQFVTGVVSATGNITGGNLSGTSIVGTLTTAAQTNITSVGTLGALSVTGDVQGGNLRTAGLISAAGTITGSTFSGAGTNLTGTAASLTVGTATVAGTVTTAAQPNITSVGTLSALAVTGNTTSGNFIGTLNGSGANVTAISATNISSGTLAQARLANAAVTLGSTALTLGATVTTVAGLSSVTSTTFVGALTGAATTAGTVTTAAQPNITSVGTMSTATITTLSTSAITKTGTDGVGNIGAAGSTFNTIFAKATSAQYADLAEKYTADADYAPGTVVVFGGTAEVTVDAADSDRRVAGVVSTNPAYIMNDGLAAEFVAAVALTGRVPCLVTGTVRKGDLMVTAGLGRARAEADPGVGTVIGKALEDHDGESGTIEVVVGRF
jgi:hypothetical protein